MWFSTDLRRADLQISKQKPKARAVAHVSFLCFLREVQVFVYFHPLPRDEGVATTHLGNKLLRFGSTSIQLFFLFPWGVFKIFKPMPWL